MSATTLSDPYAIVIDIGASKTYWGYSGDAEPRQCHTSAWSMNEKTNEWATLPAEFLELRQHYSPMWITNYDKLPEPVRHYIGMQQPQSAESSMADSERTSLSGHLNKDMLGLSLKRINELLLDDNALRDRAMFFTEPTKRSLAHMKATTEVAFEHFKVGAVSSARKATLSAFALGRLTACVCELGPLNATITPVYEGYTLLRNIQQYAVGGYFLDWMLASMMHLWDNETHCFDSKFLPYPIGNKTTKVYGHLRQSAAKAPLDEATILADVNPRYLHFSRARIVNDLKESVLAVKDNQGGRGPLSDSQRPRASGLLGGRARGQSSGDVDMGDDNDDISYELPDGKLLYVNEAISTGIPEYLFDPLGATVARDFLTPYASSLGPLVGNFPGLPTAIVANAFSCDVDLRPTLLQNIVMAGGCSTLDGLTERVAADLTRMTQVNVGKRNYLGNEQDQLGGATLKDVTSFKFKIAARTPYERSFTSWIGGSVLSSLSSYNTLWISRSEWDEFGPNIIARRSVF